MHGHCQPELPTNDSNCILQFCTCRSQVVNVMVSNLSSPDLYYLMPWPGRQLGYFNKVPQAMVVIWKSADIDLKNN